MLIYHVIQINNSQTQPIKRPLRFIVRNRHLHADVWSGIIMQGIRVTAIQLTRWQHDN